MQLRRAFNASVRRESRLTAKTATAATSSTASTPRSVRRSASASRPLFHRAQQWFSARERLLTRWLARTGQRARTGMQYITTKRVDATAQSPVVPRWWEYESELKRRLALELLLRRLFALAPESGGMKSL